MMLGKVDQRMATAICMLGAATAHQLGGMEVLGIHIWDNRHWRGRRADGRVDIVTEIPDEKLPSYLIANMAGQEAEVRWLMLRHAKSPAAARRKVRSESAGLQANFEEFRDRTGLTEDVAREWAAELIAPHLARIATLAPQLSRTGYLPGTAL